MKTLAIVSTTLLLAFLALESRHAPATLAGSPSPAPTAHVGGASLASLPLDKAFSATFDISNFPSFSPYVFNWPQDSGGYTSGRIFEGPIAVGKALILTDVQVLYDSGASTLLAEHVIGVDGVPVRSRMAAIAQKPFATPLVVRENQILRIETEGSGSSRLMLAGYLIDMADL